MALLTYKKSPFGAKAEIMYLILYDADDDDEEEEDNNIIITIIIIIMYSNNSFNGKCMSIFGPKLTIQPADFSI